MLKLHLLSNASTFYYKRDTILRRFSAERNYKTFISQHNELEVKNRQHDYLLVTAKYILRALKTTEKFDASVEE